LLTALIHEVDSLLIDVQDLLSALPRSHPVRPAIVYRLATARLGLHGLSNQKDNLDKAVLHLTELILQPWFSPEPKPNIHLIFFNLAFALLKRSKASNQPEGAVYAAKYLRHLRGQPNAAFGFPRHTVTTLLVEVLAFKVESEASNEMQNVEEMTVLCRELLTSDVPDGDTIPSITLFSKAVLSKIRPQLPDQPFDEVIECLRVVRMHKPELRVAHLALAICLVNRYCMTVVNDDYDEAASILDESIASRYPVDGWDKIVAGLQRMVTELAVLRSIAHETPEYSEEAIYRGHAFLSSGPEEDPLNYMVNHSLEDNAMRRFRYFGPIEGPDAPSGDLSFSQLKVALGGFLDVFPELDQFNQETELLEGLLSGIRNTDITKIDEAIELGRTVLASAPEYSLERNMLTSSLLELFGKILDEAFWRTNKIEYLNESISTLRQVLERPVPRFQRFTTVIWLSVCLLTRFAFLQGHRMRDLDEGLELLSQCVNDAHAGLPDRFKAACLWTSVARRTQHTSIPTSYESAVSLMQDTLLVAPTLQLQHATLAASVDSHSLPLHYASYQVDLGQLEEAIETLERGRALLWSEMRHLRASVDQLLEADPDLGHKFAAVSRDLDELTKSIQPGHKLSIDDSAADGFRAVDPFGRLLLKRRSLLKERDNLISQIQALPDFDTFLTSPSFDTLRSVASSGPVIIINHSIWRSDILILLHNTSPSLISTRRGLYDSASSLKEKLLDSRHKYGLDSNHYDETLASVLAELYNLIGKPVIDRLRQLRVPEQSRIWWCPTSVFCSLPLHAMGPIPSDEGEMRYFLDLYICSYTPTLSALIQSRNPDSGSRSSDRPSLLLVAQPDPSLPTVGGEIQVVQALDTEVTSLISEAATPAAVIDGFHQHRFVHFACHGTLEAGKPFEAGFELYGGERLTLLEIVRSHLPTAEFAFLSACHTAEVTEGSVVDEGLHLAAAVQYCGFRSVVGTTWAMVDEDGRELAEHFYKALFSTSRREQGIPCHERSAKALRFAVKKLRRKRWITLERRVNFVHYGA